MYVPHLKYSHTECGVALSHVWPAAATSVGARKWSLNLLLLPVFKWGTVAENFYGFVVAKLLTPKVGHGRNRSRQKPVT